MNFYLSRHPAGLPRKTVREVVDEMLAVKTNAGVSEPYAKELRLRLGQFADAYAVPISTVSSKQIQDWLTKPSTLAGRTQNNYPPPHQHAFQIRHPARLPAQRSR